MLQKYAHMLAFLMLCAPAASFCASPAWPTRPNPPCQADPAYIRMAKATGGAVYCKPTLGPKFDPDAFNLGISAFVVSSSQFEFKASWLVPGHGSMDSYTYPWSDLPSGRVDLLIVDFPSKLATIESLVAFNDQGQSSEPAVLQERVHDKASNVSLETWSFNTLPGSFKIALLGTTKSGGAFVMYSAESAQSGSLSDKAKGVVVWAKIFREFGPTLTETKKKRLMDQAFPQGH